MEAIKWIRLETSVFDNRKIRQLETMPDGDGMIVIWMKLLCLAGHINDCGLVYMTKDIPYTEEMLAAHFNRPINLVKMALETFRQFGMIDITDDILHVTNWERYQGLENGGEEETHHIGCTKGRKQIAINYDQIVELYNSICRSLPAVQSISDKRKKAMKARFVQYNCDMEAFRKVFENTEASSFLKGANPKNWRPTFDWLMCDANFAKVLDGNYSNRLPAPGVNHLGRSQSIESIAEELERDGK